MLSIVLTKRFEEAKSAGWQGYGLISRYPSPLEDPRLKCFEKMQTSLDAIPEFLSDQTKPYRVISETWFDQEILNLTERVGWDFFPETAAEFIWKLLGRISKSVPDHSTLQQIERRRSEGSEDEFTFGDAPNRSGRETA